MRAALLQNFAFEERLVRAFDHTGDAWFVGRDVCDCLGIRKHHQALGDLDDDERDTYTVGTPGGDQAMIVISEPGVYRLVFRSRKPEAERFKRWLAHDVLPKLRRGEGLVADPDLPTGGDILSQPLMHRLQVVREIRWLWGRAVAQSAWRKLGLPAPPPPPRSAMDEARECLRHLLDQAYDDGRQIRELLALALDDNEVERLCLLACGIRVYPDHETFVVANQHPWISKVFKGTEWAGPMAHARVLRRIAGATASGPVRMGPLQPRGTVLRADVLDEFVA